MDIQLPQILFQLINFSVVVGGVAFLLIKPIKKVLEERINRVNEGQKAAEAAIKEKESLSELRAKAKRDAQRESKKMLDETKKKADEKMKQTIESAKTSAKEEVEKQRLAWKDEKTRLVSGLNKDLVEAVVKTSEVVLTKKIDKQSDLKLINQQLNEILSKI